MAALAEAIKNLNAKELDAHEAELAACFPPPPQMSPEAQRHLVPFLEFCEQQRIRPLPCRPASCAAFLQHQTDRGVSKERVAETMAAVEAWHIASNWGSPIASPVVRIVTAASTIEPPRSWSKEEKENFKTYPRDAQEKISRDAARREADFRRGQNEIAEMKKLLRLQLEAAAETKAADNTEKETTDEDK
jgi:hypothetical protein